MSSSSSAITETHNNASSNSRSGGEILDPILQTIIMEFSPLVDEEVIKTLYQENGCDFDQTINQLYFIISDPTFDQTSSVGSSSADASNIANFEGSEGYQDFPLHSPININDQENISLLFNMFKDVKNESGEYCIVDRDFIQFLYEENDKDLFSCMSVLRKALLDDDDNAESFEEEKSIEKQKKQPPSLFAVLEDPKHKTLTEMAQELPVYFKQNDPEEKKKKKQKRNQQKNIEKKKKMQLENRERQQKLNMLTEMFPNIEQSLIESMLIACDNNVEEATMAILSQTNKPSSSNHQGSKKKTSRGVVRNDLLVGGSRWNSSSTNIPNTSGNTSHSQGSKKSAPVTLSLEMKRQKLGEIIKGKSISLDHAMEIFEQCDQNLTATVEYLSQLYPAQFKSNELLNSPSNLLIKPKEEEIIYGTTIGPQSAVIPSNIVDIKKPAVKQPLSHVALDELMQKRKHYQLPELVDTESSYLQASNQYSKLRDKFMDLAVSAQQKGNHGLATQFMSKARQYSLIVEDCREKANEIRLREQTGGSLIRKPRTIDLHGLVLSDAIDTLDEYLSKHEPHRKINIVTGTGKHSANNKPVLLPAVEQYLTENGYSFKQIAPGVFQVRTWCEYFMTSQ